MRPYAAASLGSVLGLLLSIPAPALAFRELAVGQPVPERTMPALDGGRVPLLGTARLTVFTFVRPNQDRSLQALRDLAVLERELAPKQVRFVAVASASDDRAALRALMRASGVAMPLLLDEGDALYGALGVALHPSIGIADEHHRLAGYQPFRQVNLRDALRARIQLALGEIGEAQLAAVLDPPPLTPAPDGRARARVKLARALLREGKLDAAIGQLREATARDPALAEAHAALAEALARKGACAEAGRERTEAVRLAGDGAGADGPLACGGR